MPIELYFTLQGDLRPSQTLQEALRDISIVALPHLFLEFNDY
jgi:2-keto-4-pentenoate hydratase